MKNLKDVKKEKNGIKEKIPMNFKLQLFPYFILFFLTNSLKIS